MWRIVLTNTFHGRAFVYARHFPAQNKLKISVVVEWAFDQSNLESLGGILLIDNFETKS